MASQETGYNREAQKNRLQELRQKIASMEVDGKTGEELDKLHQEHDALQDYLETPDIPMAA